MYFVEHLNWLSNALSLENHQLALSGQSLGVLGLSGNFHTGSWSAFKISICPSRMTGWPVARKYYVSINLSHYVYSQVSQFLLRVYKMHIPDLRSWSTRGTLKALSIFIERYFRSILQFDWYWSKLGSLNPEYPGSHTLFVFNIYIVSLILAFSVLYK